MRGNYLDPVGLVCHIPLSGNSNCPSVQVHQTIEMDMLVPSR